MTTKQAIAKARLDDLRRKRPKMHPATWADMVDRRNGKLRLLAQQPIPWPSQDPR